MYEEYSRPPSTFDWFEANMFELNGPKLLPYDPDLDIPLEYEVYDARHRPSALFNPSPTIDFDIESLTTTGDPPNHALKSSVGLTGNHRYPRRSTRKTPQRPPPKPPRTPKPHRQLDFAPSVDANTAYRNPSSPVRSRERDWERLRRHFAWLPKLVMQKTFDCTTQYARIPMRVHLQSHYCSPFPALNVNRRNEALATDTVYADVPDIEHGHVAAQFFVGLESLISDVYGIKTGKQFLQTLQDCV